MKIILVAFIVLLSCAEISMAAPSISRKDALGDSDIYSIAIKVFCDSVAKRIETNDRKVIFIEDYHELLKFDTLVDGKITIVKATTDDLINEYERLKGRFLMLEIFPAQIQGNTLTIGVSRYYFNYRTPLIGRNKIEYALEGGYTMHFRFNCDVQRFKIARVKEWGI